MHSTIDYSKRLAPAFDAVQDIKDYLGQERFNKVSPEMAKIKHCGQFAMYASLAGINGFPVKAWYELYHGQGSWNETELEAL